MIVGGDAVVARLAAARDGGDGALDPQPPWAVDVPVVGGTGAGSAATRRT